MKTAAPSRVDEMGTQAITPDGARTPGQRRQDLPSLAELIEQFVDVDSPSSQFCDFCSVREVDPDYAPMCSRHCRVAARWDD